MKTQRTTIPIVIKITAYMLHNSFTPTTVVNIYSVDLIDTTDLQILFGKYTPWDYVHCHVYRL